MQILGPKNLPPVTPRLPASAPAAAAQAASAQAASPAQQSLGVLFGDALCQCPPDKRTKLPAVDEATVLTEVEINTATHRRTGGDPLIVRGTARPGATVRVYNPDLRGWPEVGTAVADAQGAYAIRVDDTSRFARGDRVLVTAHEPGKSPSGGVLKATVPFTQTTYTHSDYLNGALTQRTSRTTLTPDLADADDRPPYYDDTAVRTTTRLERGGMRLELTGGIKAVPPGSKIMGGQTSAVAADDGSFKLTLRNAQPGSTAELRVIDVHGRTTTVPVAVRSLRAEVQALADGAQWTADGALRLRGQLGLAAGDAVVVRDVATGAIHRMVADAAGCVDGRLTGLSAWSVLEVGVETQGIRSNELARAVATPSGLHLVKDEACTPSLEASLGGARLACIDGQDVLALPEVDHLPPFGRIDVLRGGEVAYEVRADAAGRTPQVGLGGVVPGEKLALRTYDASGRRVGVDVPAYTVPAEEDGVSPARATRASESARLADLVALIGTGRVAMPATGERAELRARLLPEETRLGPRIELNEASGRTELRGAFPEGTMKEAAGASAYDSARLAVVDWETGQRNIVFDLYRNNQLDQRAVRVPLPQADGTLPTVNGVSPLPTADEVVPMLSRAVAFAALARSLGAGPGEAAFDGPMRAARTLLFALDRLAVAAGDAAAADQLRARAAEALGSAAVDVVDASRWVPGAETTGATPASVARALWSAASQKTGVKAWALRAG